MQQQVQRPVQRTATRRVNDDKQDRRPASARQFHEVAAIRIAGGG